MSPERTRRPERPFVTTLLAAFSAAAGCRGPEAPPAAPPESLPFTPQPTSTAPAQATPVSNAPGPAEPASSNDPNAKAHPVVATTTSSNPKPAPASCGKMPGDKIEKLRWSYGHDAECDRLETLWANVPHADLVCKTDDDCTVITSDGNCINLALAKVAAARSQYSKAPCGNPVSGACMGHPNKATCSGGCCGVE